MPKNLHGLERTALHAALVALLLVLQSPPASGDDGHEIFSKRCQICHGADGGGTAGISSFTRPMVVAEVESYVAREMPLDDPGTCSGACAHAVAVYIVENLGWGTPGVSRGPVLRRLSRFEYREAVRDLFGESDARIELPSDAVSNGFEGGGPVSVLHADAYALAAESLSVRLVGHVPTMAKCAPSQAGTPACAERFVRAYAPRAYRHSLTQEEVDRLLALYAGAGNDTEGLRRVIEALLQSPYFLYHGISEAPGVPVIGRAMADRLASLVWDSLPDPQLVAEADAGRLVTPQQVLQQAQRLAGDPKAKAGLRPFFRQWLTLTPAPALYRDPAAFPSFNRQLADDMAASFDALVDRVWWEKKGSFADLLLTSEIFVTPGLAPIYGLPAGVPGLTLTQADRSRRVGLLTHPFFLTGHSYPAESSPILRGVAVARQLLCHPLPPPPGNNPIVGQPAAQTTRQRVEAFTADKTCQTCHATINPLGFGFEHFDAIGAFRDQDSGLPIDATGSYQGPAQEAFHFDGAVALAEALSTSEQARRCFVRQLFRYALGRMDTRQDQNDLDFLYHRFGERSGTIRDLLVDITQTRAFLYP